MKRSITIPSIVFYILLMGWILFFLGWFLQLPKVEWWHSLLFSMSILLPIFITIFLKKKNWISKIIDIISDGDSLLDATTNKHINLYIFFAAALSLYLELMIIRLHSSYFQVFAYFKNISLLSCFLGLSIGYLLGSKRPIGLKLVLPLIAIQIIFLHFLRLITGSFFLQNPVSEEFTMGLMSASGIIQNISVYGFLILIFTFNALCFIPLGSITSRLMVKKNNLSSYSWNLLGSIFGIVFFSLLSFAWTPPSIWIFFASLVFFSFFIKDSKILTLSAFTSLFLIILIALPVRFDKIYMYSPYQILSVNFEDNSPPIVKVSNVYFQKILDLTGKIYNNQNDKFSKEALSYYKLPYRFKLNPKDVLVVGSGTGNDVAAAILNGVSKIDAVEIDPVILSIGKALHPNNPYGSKKVNVIVDDARSYIRNTKNKYDLIVYGLLDSHTLLSNTGGIRLDSYVYTIEGFKEARSKLKHGGVVSLTFSLVSPELGRKLYLMLQQAFDGMPPVVYRSGYDGGYTFLISDNKTLFPNSVGSFDRNVTANFANNNVKVDVSTDDWPFFYMPVRKYPVSYLFLLSLLLLISIILVKNVSRSSGLSFIALPFFLGAGFMLVETKAITELALVFGSTWVVISAVIGSILIMSFIANIFVLKINKKGYNIFIFYLFLAIALIAGTQARNIYSIFQNQIIPVIVLTIPVFFSGYIFSNELKRTVYLPTFLSSNLLGAMFGGFLEYNSMYFGFGLLSILAIILYFMAFILSFNLEK